MSTKKYNYLKIDLQRAFGTWRFVIGVIGVCFALLYNSFGSLSVIGWLCNISGNAVLIMAMFVFSGYPYAGVFCEDLEHHFDRQMIIRGDIFPYTCSKIAVVFMSAAVTALVGFLITVLVITLELGIPEEEVINSCLDNCYSLYRQLALERRFILFTLCTGAHLAALSGVLAVIGLLCSLFIKNRMLVYIMPVAFLYIEDILIQRLMGWERGSLFSLNCMGVTSLGMALETHSWQIYYFEITALLVGLGAITCLCYKRKVV